MGSFFHAFLVLSLLSILTTCSSLPYWLRRTHTRHTGLPALTLSPGAKRMPLGKGSARFQTGGRGTPMSGRNKLFMDHLQLSLHRGHGPGMPSRTPAQARKRPSNFRSVLPDTRRLSLPPLRGKSFNLPRIEGLKTFSSHRLHKPIRNIRLKPFLTRLSSTGQPSRLPPVLPKGGHRKREHLGFSEGKAKIESNPLILTYDSPPLKAVVKDKPSLSHQDKYARDHSFRYKDKYLTAEEFFAQYPSAHLLPCDHTDRYNCLNGGICVYVDSLDEKTCRCPLGYTGHRCEMVDQEYLVSLYANSMEYS